MVADTHPRRDDIDLLDGNLYARDPHDIWAWMREHAPAYYDAKNDVWAITRYQDVLAIERDAKRFSSIRAPRPHGQPLPLSISMDNPEHQRRRALVYQGFTPKRVAEREAHIRAVCNEIVDRVCERGECDFVWDVAAPLPLLLIADMLGFDPSVFDDLLRWSDDIVRGQTSTPTPEVEAARARAMADFRTLQLEVIADRRSRGPQNDLISILCHAEVDGERLDDDSIVLETLLILVGGDETTRHVITMGQLALFDHPDQSSVMRSGSNSLRSGVEEMLRWVSPVKNMARTVVGEVSLHGEILRDGDQVLLMYPSANRDADEFPEPDRFDARRDPNHHLAFGFGPHYCLGQALARLELAVMFDVLFRRLPDLEPANDEPLPFRTSNFIVGPEAMPVRFTPSARTRP